MVKLILRRVALSVPVVFIVTALSFVLIDLLPGNAASAILGPSASAQQINQLTQSLGLGRPIYTQYWQWLERLAHGNLGVSLDNGQSVTSLLNPDLGVSI
jgi:peptide/nickel transport system permease protein